MKPTIRNKLTFGLAGIIVLFLAVAGIGAYAVFNLRASAYQATRIDGRLNAIALEIQVHNLEAERRVKKYLTQAKAEGASAVPAQYLEESRFEIHEIHSLAAEAAGLARTAATRSKFDKIAEAANRFDQATNAAVETVKAGAAAAETKAAIDAYGDAAEELHESAEDGELAGRDASQSSLERIAITSKRTVNLVVIISLVAIIAGVLVSYKLARAILRPVQHLKDVAENVSMGNLDVSVRRYSDDEIGDLADSFSRMVTAVKFFRMEAELSQAEAAADGGQK
jgi:methyl-accepting chemotaxis protein